MMRQRPTSSTGSGGYVASNRPSQDHYGGYRGGSSGGDGYGQQNGYGGYGAAGSNNNLYGGYSTPAEVNHSRSKKSQMSLGSVMNSPWMLTCILMALWSVVVIVLWMNARGKYNSILRQFNLPNTEAFLAKYKSLQADVSSAQQDRQRTKTDNRELGVRFEELAQENQQLLREVEELKVKYADVDHEQRESHMLFREDALQEQMALLQTAIRKESRRTVLER
jgi:hypothetical protein